jgi:hypothetical protein
MWSVTYTFCIHIKCRVTSALTIYQWVFLHLAEPIRVAWHSCTVFTNPQHWHTLFALPAPKSIIKCKGPPLAILAHICLQQSAMPRCYILQLSCSWLLTSPFCYFLPVFSMREYTILIVMSPPDFISNCIPQSRPFIRLTTATTSAIGCARDMPGSASWPIGKTPFLKSRRQTRYPEARRFNRCILCLRETRSITSLRIRKSCHEGII